MSLPRSYLPFSLEKDQRIDRIDCIEADAQVDKTALEKKVANDKKN
jgi:hypothetical protein